MRNIGNAIYSCQNNRADGGILNNDGLVWMLAEWVRVPF